MLFWMAVQSGWQPPKKISRSLYYKLKASPNPSPLRAWAACASSYASKWFGGYVGETPTRSRLSESFDATMKKAAKLQNVLLHRCDYRTIVVDDNTVVYCDPPYANTTAYNGAPNFNTDIFWNTVNRWAVQGALVLISEYTVPQTFSYLWRSVFTRTKQESLSRTGTSNPIHENLYAPRFDYKNITKICDLLREE